MPDDNAALIIFGDQPLDRPNIQSQASDQTIVARLLSTLLSSCPCFFSGVSLAASSLGALSVQVLLPANPFTPLQS
jgi:hypothetical protein